MDDGLGDLLHRVVLLIGEAARQSGDDPDGLSYRQMRLLGTLEDIQPVTQHQLAQALSVSDPTVSRALRPLREAGLIQVRTDPDHARRRLVSLTQTGRDTFHTNGEPLHNELRDALVEADFPYERYLRDTTRLAHILEPG